MSSCPPEGNCYAYCWRTLTPEQYMKMVELDASHEAPPEEIDRGALLRMFPNWPEVRR